MKTVSLSLSKQLKEAGYPQEGYFWWSNAMDKPFWRLENKEFFKIDKRRDVASPTADEILEQLPIGLQVYKTSSPNGEKFTYRMLTRTFPMIEENCLADSAAKMWLYLKQNGLLEGKNE